MEWETLNWPQIQAIGVALGIGLLIGVERERGQQRRDVDSGIAAGARSFSIVALLGVLSSMAGEWLMVAALLGVAGLALLGYSRTAENAPGLTTEFALLLVFVLGALAPRWPGLVAGMGVLLALLLASKRHIHRFSRELISESEMRDGLLLAAAALIVLPMLPNEPVDPLQVLNPQRIWLLVVLVMAVSALGHVTLRLVGARRGLPVAGFFAGYVSSTAATAGFGERVSNNSKELQSAIAAALLANLASLSLFIPLLLTISGEGLRLLALPLGCAGAVLLVGSLFGLRDSVSTDNDVPTASSRMFRFRHAVVFALLISLMVAGADLLHRWLGAEAAILGATIASLAEVHAAGASLAELFGRGSLSPAELRWGFVALLVASSASKTVIAFISGGRRYGLRVGLGLAGMAGGGIGGALLAAVGDE